MHLKAFVAGFVATLVFHQGLVLILSAMGVFPGNAFNTAATWPLGVPQFLSLAFWGGVWGVPLWLVVRRRRSPSRWLWALAFGAVGPTAVALLVVFSLKGIAVGPLAPVLGAVLNGVWGLGTLVLIDGLRHLPPR
ncbi:MAG: hypothetical protein BRD57_02735 [Proteobacteria bacterium SW_6_67_9]|nr:MAG: hypothetical protein BRD57_02735 [Proteobacteria bacterium SW_6_67_9]